MIAMKLPLKKKKKKIGEPLPSRVLHYVSVNKLQCNVQCVCALLCNVYFVIPVIHIRLINK